MILFLICEKIYKTKVVCVGYHYSHVEEELHCTMTLPQEVQMGEQYEIEWLNIYMRIPSNVKHFQIVIQTLRTNLGTLLPAKHVEEVSSILKRQLSMSWVKFAVRHIEEDVWHAEVSPPGVDVIYVICLGGMLERLRYVPSNLTMLLLVQDRVDVIPVGQGVRSSIQLFSSFMTESSDVVTAYNTYMNEDSGRIVRGIFSVGDMIELSLMYPEHTFRKVGGYLHIGRDKVKLENFYCRGWKGVDYVCRIHAQRILQMTYRGETAPEFMCVKRSL